jgi:uncharacterized protein
MKAESTFDFSDERILKNIVSRIVEIANPDKIILFGSRATGKARKDSDYDICVLKNSIKNYRRFAYKIRSHIDVFAPIDIIATSPALFKLHKDKWYYVYSDIDRTGKVVYEKR